jgi:ABC-type spermidine/putrescine transport system permease subunit I
MTTKGIDLFAIKVLRAFAWVNLISCLVFSFLILHEFGVTFITEEDLFSNYTEKTINPFAITVSLASILAGIFGWAFCLVVAHMAENLIALKKNTAGSLPQETGGTLNL